MNEDINEAGRDREALSVRGAARKLLTELDDLIGQSTGVSGLHMNGDLAPWDELVSGGRFEQWLGSIETVRQALAVERSNMPAIPGAEVALEGVELIKAGGQISPDHIRAIVQAAEWAFEAAAAFELRWDADMRAIKLWQAAGEGRNLIWPDHCDLTLWLLELIEHRPACPSPATVDAMVRKLRDVFAASPIVNEAMQMMLDLANALISSSRRVMTAESNVQIIPKLIVSWLRTQSPQSVMVLNAADRIERGDWLPSRRAAIMAARGARPPLQLVEGGGGAAADGQAFAYRVGACRICGCTEFNACDVPIGEVDEDGVPEDARRCGWADATHTLCDNPKCVEQAGIDGARASYEDEPGEIGSACEEAIVDKPPRIHDSLAAVLRRPDVQEAIAKAVAVQRGADWQEATEGGRKAFREEAAGLLRVALDQPR